MSAAFPLSWPDGWPRSKARKDSPYRVTTELALTELLHDLRLMGARHVIVSSNVPLRRDGTMYRGDHSDSAMSDPGVAVYWDARDGRALVAACDAWRTPGENVRALGLTVSALRAIERAGASHLLERAYSGFARLPAGDRERPWWEVLGVERGASLETIRAAYRELAVDNHPDRGGDAQRMSEINRAWQEARA
jgi:hypothetical protein